MYMNSIVPAGFTGADARHLPPAAERRSPVFPSQRRSITKAETNGRTRRNATIAWCTTPPSEQAKAIQKGDHLLLEGEIQYREYDRTVETTEGPVKVPKTEIVVYSIARLDQSAKVHENGEAA